MLQQSVPLWEDLNLRLSGLTLSEAIAFVMLVLKCSKSCDPCQKCTTSSCSFASFWNCNNILMLVCRRSNQMTSCFLSLCNFISSGWNFIVSLSFGLYYYHCCYVILLSNLFYFSHLLSEAAYTASMHGWSRALPSPPPSHWHSTLSPSEEIQMSLGLDLPLCHLPGMPWYSVGYNTRSTIKEVTKHYKIGRSSCWFKEVNYRWSLVSLSRLVFQISEFSPYYGFLSPPEKWCTIARRGKASSGWVFGQCLQSKNWMWHTHWRWAAVVYL